MALDAELSNLKSAGTYRFERDLSTISNDTTSFSNLRLVVGFSKTGPFNTPMLVTNSAQFIKLYGPIDRSLEKRGSYFHRSCLVALSAGPILCLNLLNLDPDIDQVTQKSFSVNTKYFNKPLITLPLISIYDTDKFWFASEQSYLDGINTYLNSTVSPNVQSFTEDLDEKLIERYTNDYSDDILHFTNVGKKPISILVKKASSYATMNYECTLNDWYGKDNVPEYLNGTSFVSDYMVEVYVIGGDFGPALDPDRVNTIPSFMDLDDDGETEVLKQYMEVEATDDKNPYERFTSDIIFQKYFDKNGFIRKENDTDTTDTKLSRFLNLSSVNLIGKYTGSLIPNFVTKFGQNIWIQKLVNDDTNTTGLFCVENIEKLEDVTEINGVINEKIDLIGNNIPAIMKKEMEEGDTNDEKIDLNFLSYKASYTAPTQQLYFYAEINNDASEIDDDSRDGYVIYDRYSEGDKDGLTTPYKYAWRLNKVVIEKGNLAGEYEANQTLPLPGAESDPTDALGYMSLPGNTDGDLTEIIYTYESNFSAGVIPSKIKVFNSQDESITVTKFSYNETPNPLITKITMFNDNVVKFNGHDYKLDVLHTTNRPDSDLVTLRGNEVLVPAGANIVAGDYIISGYYYAENEETETSNIEFSRLTRIIEVRGVYADTSADSDFENIPSRLRKVGLKVVCADVVDRSNDYIQKFRTVDQFADRFQWTCLKGYQIREELMPNGTNERQNEILDLLRENPKYSAIKSSLYKSLCDNDYIQWRYLIDTFGGGIEENSKSVYTLLCQGRKSALAIINCPSQVEFKKSTDPSFVNRRNSVEAEFIAKGGDATKTPSFLYSLPTAEQGASFGAYYYPFLKISDLSAPKSVPPAPYVSNLFISKYNNANAWSIVAGQRRGVISGNQIIGVEATLVHDNRDWLEPMGINSIIWENGVGVEIYANKTAKQTPKSALSSIHVRECCIYIQDNIESILRRYIFEMNTAQTRLEIKTLVDNFLEGVKTNGGIYEYKTVMDTTNNTQEVIDNNMGVIDIYIEPVRGLEILTQRLTVMKTGGIAAGAFE